MPITKVSLSPGEIETFALSILSRVWKGKSLLRTKELVFVSILNTFEGQEL